MKLAPNCSINLPTLLETRLLIQSNSGGGKSYATRKLLEETAGSVQQLVIDPEGEFATLREKFDYVICAPHGGDAVANPKTAAILARKLLETGVSAVLDIYDLKAHERQSFVRLFLDALVNAPRELWRPVMIVLDEAHVFCPQNGSAEASQAVIDVATRGRKRGQCLVLATQRLSKLHKDTAAELLNKLIGRTSLDVDVKRAADELGMSNADAVRQLRSLEPGEFFEFGPALSWAGPNKIKVGRAQTSHPKAGDRMLKAPPAPSDAIRKQLAKLGDLPKEAEAEAKTIAELKSEIAKLKRNCAYVESEDTIKQLRAELDTRKTAMNAAQANIRELQNTNKVLQAQIQLAFKCAETITKNLATSPAGPTPVYGGPPPQVIVDREALRLPVAANPAPRPPANTSDMSQPGYTSLRSGAVRILKELAARHPAGYSRSQVGALTKFAPKGGTFNTYLSDLRKHAFIEERDDLLYATKAGVEQFGELPPAPTTHAEAMAQWAKALRSGAYKMLEAVVREQHGGLHRANLADLVNMQASGGTFNTYLSDLRRNGLIEERGKRLFANNILFPEG